MSVPFKPTSDNLNEAQKFSGNIFDFLPSTHDCFVFKDLFEALDTSSIEKKYSPKGQHAYHPKQIVGILIYGYTHNVFSSRQLEQHCNQDIAFMFIADMSCPNFRTLSNFRKDNPEFFDECFKQTVLLAIQLGMASLGHVSLDGSKFKADSSKHKAMSYKYLLENELKLCKEIDELIKQGNSCDTEENTDYQDKSSYELPEELEFKQQRLEQIKKAKEALEAREELLNPGQAIDDKKQISFADTDARIMGKNGKFDYSYNPQISVDSDYQIIVGQHVSQNANDKQEVKAGLESIKENTGELPEKMSLDNGYESGKNLEALAESGVDAYVATERGEKTPDELLEETDRPLVKADFRYDKEADCFHCPGGQKLEQKSKNKEGKCVYQGDVKICVDCPFFSRCCSSKKGAARTINTDEYEDLRQDMRDQMKTSEAKEIYKRRKVIVEPVFGHIKNGGFQGFSLRSLDKVKGEFSLVCAGHNMKKIVKAIMTGSVCPAFA